MYTKKSRFRRNMLHCLEVQNIFPLIINIYKPSIFYPAGKIALNKKYIYIFNGSAVLKEV
jgi:hypothetical protein